MRIAIYHNLSSGGAKRSVYEATRGLAERGHALWEFTTSASKSEGEFLPLASYCAGMKVWDLQVLPSVVRWIPLLTPYLNSSVLMLNLHRTDLVSQKIARAIDEMSFDLVFVYDCMIAENPHILRYLSTPNVFFCRHGAGQAISPWAVKRHQESLYVKLKKYYYEPARLLSGYIRRRAARINAQSADEVWTNSYFARECLYAAYAIDSAVIFGGVDSTKFHPLNLPRKEFILAVGALHPWKGYEFLFKSIGAIPAQIRPQLIIAANSIDATYKLELDRYAQQLNIDYVIQKIWDDDAMVRLYNQALMLVFTPIMEPFGQVVLEALACGTPVVAVREGGPRETVLDGTVGLLTDREPAQFAEAVQRLIQDSVLRQQMGVAGVDYVRTRWTWERTIDQIEERFREILADRKI